MITIHTVAIAGALLVCSASAVAQEPPRPPVTGAVAMQALRTQGHPGTALRTLRQVDGPVDRHVVDELADSLTAFVMANDDPALENQAAMKALAVLGKAGDTTGEGTAYAGAGERLMRIALSPGGAFAGGAVYLIALLPDRHEAITRLSEFASSTSRSAYLGIHALEGRGLEGQAALRSLHQRGVVRDPEARRSIESIAHRQGWGRNSDTTERRPPLTGAEAMRTLRVQGHPGRAARTLRQLDGPVSRAVQDELADSLVAFIIAHGADRAVYPDAALRALDALGTAGVMNGEGTPYPGAGERLMRIVTASGAGMAGGALVYVSMLANRQDAMVRLSELASSTSRFAYGGIRMLTDMGPDGVAAIRILHERGVVREPEARRSIESIAHGQGWSRSSDTTSSSVRRPPG